MRIAIYAGSFDPFTVGHYEILYSASRLFDKVIIAVGVNPNKPGWLAVEHRMDAISNTIFDGPFENVEVKSFTGLLADFAVEEGAQYLVRGLRPLGDWETEYQMATINRELSINPNSPKLETVFLLSNTGSENISSSLIREVYKLRGLDWVRKWIPYKVADKIEEVMNGTL